MTAELQPGQNVPYGEPPRTEPGAVVDGEHAKLPPILAHFYGYCESVGLDVASTDPQESERLATGVWEYLRLAIDAKNASLAADPRNTIPLARRVPEHFLRSRLHEFYRDHGSAIPTDAVLRERRSAYLVHGVRNAEYHRDKFPEIGLTEKLSMHLSDAGHSLAADNAMILLAVTGESLHGLRI